MARYLNIYKSGQSKNKKINSSWNTHSIKKRPCTFLRIMISYLCVKFQSLTSLRRRDILVTDKRTGNLLLLREFVSYRSHCLRNKSVYTCQWIYLNLHEFSWICCLKKKWIHTRPFVRPSVRPSVTRISLRRRLVRLWNFTQR